MGRNKGESYRKYNLKPNPKIMCPRWTLTPDTIDRVREFAYSINKKPSHVVEDAIKILLDDHQKYTKDFSNIFRKN